MSLSTGKEKNGVPVDQKINKMEEMPFYVVALILLVISSEFEWKQGKTK